MKILSVVLLTIGIVMGGVAYKQYADQVGQKDYEATAINRNSDGTLSITIGLNPNKSDKAKNVRYLLGVGSILCISMGVIFLVVSFTYGVSPTNDGSIAATKGTEEKLEAQQKQK